ncbi:hypothetical protein [Acidisphaera sp. L21]|uniref:hypothetical protein n=1 Tax=Acidisphaera sp. L21 TaxID=1641851 RepID=UPI00131CD354|nr:hypothetical protein [Acidisphaera sp. L21]
MQKKTPCCAKHDDCRRYKEARHGANARPSVGAPGQGADDGSDRAATEDGNHVGRIQLGPLPVAQGEDPRRVGYLPALEAGIQQIDDDDEARRDVAPYVPATKTEAAVKASPKAFTTLDPKRSAK